MGIRAEQIENALSNFIAIFEHIDGPEAAPILITIDDLDQKVVGAIFVFLYL
jgi:hypothetical protein